MNEIIFWDVIGSYNQSTYIIQIILSIVLLISFAFEEKGKELLPVQCVLGICNLYAGIVFELIYGTEAIQKYFAAPLFIIIGILMFLEGIKNRKQRIQPVTFGGKILLMLVLMYPIVSLMLGHQFPQMVLYMMPCPIACFSILACSRYKKTNKFLMSLLIVWGMTGVKSLFFNVMEDSILFICGVYGIVYFCTMLKKNKSPNTYVE